MQFVAQFENTFVESCRTINRTGTLKLKAKTYKWFYSFKNSFVAQTYLSFITTKRFRDTLTRFRLKASQNL